MKTKIWDKLQKIRIKNKEVCVRAFVNLLTEIEGGNYKFEEGFIDRGKYVIVSETNRKTSNFVHVVPKECYKLFKEMQKKLPDAFLGFSILCGKVGGTDLRLSCFGIPTTDLTKALIKRK